MNTSLAVLGMGGGEMVLVFAAILVLFGAKKIPEFAKGLGQGIKEFKKASREVTDEINNAVQRRGVFPSPSQAAASGRARRRSQSASHRPQNLVPRA